MAADSMPPANEKVDAFDLVMLASAEFRELSKRRLILEFSIDQLPEGV